MATKDRHIEKADRNAAFAEALPLDSEANIDWAATALFYSGLHYVEAYLEKIGLEPHQHNTHGKRDKIIVLDETLRPIHREYADLKNLSTITRYQCVSTRPSSIQDEALPALATIQQHIRKLL